MLNWGLVISCSSSTTNSEKTSRVEELPFYEEATFTPNWVSEEDVSDDFHQIPAFELVNQEGTDYGATSR